MTMRSFDSRYRRRKDARLSERQVIAAHRLYMARGWSLRTLGAMLYGPLGYASANSAANSLREMFVAAGLPRRERVAATVMASQTHGLRPRQPSSQQRDAYNALRRERRERQERCGAFTTDTRPCPRPAMVGSDFCFAHNPATKELRDTILATARASRRPVAPLAGALSTSTTSKES